MPYNLLGAKDFQTTLERKGERDQGWKPKKIKICLKKRTGL